MRQERVVILCIFVSILVNTNKLIGERDFNPKIIWLCYKSKIVLYMLRVKIELCNSFEISCVSSKLFIVRERT
jgi:hypothetical protein